MNYKKLRDELIERRNKITDSTFWWITGLKEKELADIDKQLDLIGYFTNEIHIRERALAKKHKKKRLWWVSVCDMHVDKPDDGRPYLRVADLEGK